MDVLTSFGDVTFFLVAGLNGLLLAIQLYFILFVYSKLAYHQNSPGLKQASPPLSVIICARNEEENLRRHLPAILNQQYPEFEIILVNDFSEDETKWLLRDLAAQYAKLKVVEIAEHVRLKHGKKFAVTLGIKAASHEHLIFTDADCMPQSDQWLHHMANAFSGGEEIVLGYSPYTAKPGLLNALIRFETFHTAISYLSYALKGDAYMGVGRNMGYTKSLFFRGKGFAAHMHIPSGDDDLFVNQNATPHNTVICIEPEAHVWSEPKTTWAAYARQKTRHAGASKVYRPKHRLMLGIQLVSSLLFYVIVITIAILFPQYWYFPLGLYLIRLLAQVVIYRTAMRKLQISGLIWFLPILDVAFYIYICVNGFFAQFKKSVIWK